MTRSLTRKASPARWHFKGRDLRYPYWSRRLTLQEFAAHDYVMNSSARASRMPIEAFEIRCDDDEQVVGVVWSTNSDDGLGHARRSNRFAWHFVNWRMEVRDTYRPEWDPRQCREWHARDRAVKAMLKLEAERRLELARESAARRDADALDDFYV